MKTSTIVNVGQYLFINSETILCDRLDNENYNRHCSKIAIVGVNLNI